MKYIIGIFLPIVLAIAGLTIGDIGSPDQVQHNSDMEILAEVAKGYGFPEREVCSVAYAESRRFNATPSLMNTLENLVTEADLMSASLGNFQQFIAHVNLISAKAKVLKVNKFGAVMLEWDQSTNREKANILVDVEKAAHLVNLYYAVTVKEDNPHEYDSQEQWIRYISTKYNAGEGTKEAILDYAETGKFPTENSMYSYGDYAWAYYSMMDISDDFGLIFESTFECGTVYTAPHSPQTYVIELTNDDVAYEDIVLTSSGLSVDITNVDENDDLVGYFGNVTLVSNSFNGCSSDVAFQNPNSTNCGGVDGYFHIEEDNISPWGGYWGSMFFAEGLYQVDRVFTDGTFLTLSPSDVDDGFEEYNLSVPNNADSIQFWITSNVFPFCTESLVFKPLLSIDWKPDFDSECSVELCTQGNGGVPPYSYEWANEEGNTSPCISTDVESLPSWYYVTVTDANGAEATSNYWLSEKDLPGHVYGVEWQILQYPACGDGLALVNIDYIYGNYTPGGFSVSLNGEAFVGNAGQFWVPPGSHLLTIESIDNDCSSYEEVISIPELLQIFLETKTDVKCNGGSDGSLQVDLVGGVQEYTDITWSTGDSAVTQIDSLVAGNYTVTVTDATGCTASATFEVVQPDPLQILVNQEGGVWSADAIGGTPNYIFSWVDQNGFVTQGSVIAPETPGPYTVSVVDGATCSASEVFTLTSTGVQNALPKDVRVIVGQNTITIEGFNGSYNLISFSGQIVRSGSGSYCDITGLSSGVYILQMKTDSGLYVYKLNVN